MPLHFILCFFPHCCQQNNHYSKTVTNTCLWNALSSHKRSWTQSSEPPSGRWFEGTLRFHLKVCVLNNPFRLISCHTENKVTSSRIIQTLSNQKSTWSSLPTLKNVLRLSFLCKLKRKKDANQKTKTRQDEDASACFYVRSHFVPIPRNFIFPSSWLTAGIPCSNRIREVASISRRVRVLRG